MTDNKETSEELNFGPFHIKRVGRVIEIESSLDEEGHKEFINGVKKRRPELKKEIDKSIQDLLQIVTNYNPLELLAPISVVNLTSDPETYTELTHIGNESLVEYLLSMVTSLPFPLGSKKPTSEIVQKTTDILKEIQNKIIGYYGDEIAEGKYSKKEAELRFRMMNYSLMVRGPSYPQHVEQMFLELFAQHDAFLIKEFGFSSEQFLEFVKKVEGQLENNINKSREAGLKPFRQAFEKFQLYSKKNQKLSQQKLIESFKEENKALIEEGQRSIDYLTDLGGSKVFQIETGNSMEIKILKSISIKLGDNREFLEIKGYGGWFLNPSRIYEKPIVSYENNFFCFHPQILFRNVTFILEKLIEAADGEYLKSFYISRDKYLEEKGIKLLSTVLKVDASKVHRNLHYGNFELDGLIQYDDALFLVEAKAGKLSESAKRGSIKAFMSDMNDLLGEAHKQGNRALEYIKKSKEATFCDEHGNEILKIRKDEYKHFFIISLYFEPIGHIISNISFMSDLGVVDNEKHWAVYINDLRVISELVDNPSLFVHYLTRRLEVNKIPQFNCSDELDTFMVYLREGLYFEKTPPQIQFIGYTEDLDNYYLFLAGRRSKVEKPTQKMPMYFKIVLEKLEFQRPRNFVTASLALLSCDEKTRIMISEQIQRCEGDYKIDSGLHSISLVFEKPGVVLLMSTMPNSKLMNRTNMWANKYFQDGNIKEVILICWEPQISLSDRSISVFIFNK